MSINQGTNPDTGDLIPGSAGHTLLSSLSSNLFDVMSSIRTLVH